MLWFISALVLGALIISAAVQGELTAGHMGLALVILLLAAIATPFLSRWKDGEAQIMKAKRQRIDNMLRDMSDEELLELKQRLSTGDYDEESILEVLGDDGELVQRR